MVVLKVLALDDPAFIKLRIANDNRELAVVQLRLRSNSLLLFLNELSGVPSTLLVVDAVQVLLNDLSVVCFR